jgi:8-oxo-dGTP pyrophosphatase MutT (NUDIX family)
MVGGRRNRAGDHLTAPDLGERLLGVDEAGALDAPGKTDAAVLVAMHGWPDHAGLVFTERRGDLRRHPGEISFPGGRRDPEDSNFVATALREAQEEIGLDPASVEIAGALPPVGTFVTGYRVFPIVGLLKTAPSLVPNPDEVAAVLEFDLTQLRESFAMRRLIRRGLPIRTPAFQMGDHLIWGATARILAELIARLEPLFAAGSHWRSDPASR